MRPFRQEPSDVWLLPGIPTTFSAEDGCPLEVLLQFFRSPRPDRVPPEVQPDNYVHHVLPRVFKDFLYVQFGDGDGTPILALRSLDNDILACKEQFSSRLNWLPSLRS